MKFAVKVFLLVIVVSCSTRPKIGELGNYQVVEGATKYNFHVIMKPCKNKAISSKTYFSYSHGKIHHTQGGFTGKLLHGNYQEIDIDGQILVVGNFKTGLKEGHWIYYQKSGELTKELTFSKGDTASNVKIYKNNQVFKEIVPLALKKKKRKEKKMKYFQRFKKKENVKVVPNDSTVIK